MIHSTVSGWQRVQMTFWLFVYVCSLFPLNVWHQHETACSEKEEQDVCHVSIYHAERHADCTHKQHFLPMLKVCKVCKNYFATSVVIFIEGVAKQELASLPNVIFSELVVRPQAVFELPLNKSPPIAG